MSWPTAHENLLMCPAGFYNWCGREAVMCLSLSTSWTGTFTIVTLFLPHTFPGFMEDMLPPFSLYHQQKLPPQLDLFICGDSRIGAWVYSGMKILVRVKIYFACRRDVNTYHWRVYCGKWKVAKVFVFFSHQKRKSVSFDPDQLIAAYFRIDFVQFYLLL